MIVSSASSYRPARSDTHAVIIEYAVSVDGPSELHLPGRAFLDIGASFLFPARHALEVPANDEQPACFAAGVRTVEKPSAELQTVVDRSAVPERVDAEPADRRRFEPEVAEHVRDPGGSLELFSRVAVRPADVLAQEVEHLGQSLFVSELLELRGARTQGRHSVVHQAAAHRLKRRLPGFDQRARRAIAGQVRRDQPVVERCFSLVEVATLDATSVRDPRASGVAARASRGGGRAPAR